LIKLSRHKLGISSYEDSSKFYENCGGNIIPQNKLDGHKDTGHKAPYDKANLYQINSNQSPLQLSSPLNENFIRKIIKDEFDSLIIPYQKEVHNKINFLEKKINNNTSKKEDLISKNLGVMTNLNKGRFGYQLNDLDFGKNQNIENNNLYELRDKYNNRLSAMEESVQALKKSVDIINNNYKDKNEFWNIINEIPKLLVSIKNEIAQANKNSMKQTLDDMKRKESRTDSRGREVNSINPNLNNLNNKYDNSLNNINTYVQKKSNDISDLQN